MSKKYAFKRILWWLVACIVCAAAFFWIFSVEEQKTGQTRVISLWHIDTFEGGKGSRAAFLGKIASRFEKEHEGTVIMVSSRTVEGAKEGLASGETPDMISFGSYFPYLTVTGTPTVWCKGGYAIYSLQEDFSLVNVSNTVLSVGGRNQPSVAAALYGLESGAVQEDATTAYVKFLGGKYQYLLGTQRDACRFASRGASVFALPLTEFSDLQQYILPLSTENKELSDEFIKYLLTENSQKLLSSIGMLSPVFDIYSSGDGVLDELEKASPVYTVSPFMDDAATLAMKAAAESGNQEVLKNFLKRS